MTSTKHSLFCLLRALVLLSMPLSVFAQLPSAPQPLLSSPVNRVLIAADFGVRINDAFTTWEDRPAHCLGCYEKALPQSMANSLPAMLLYSAGVSGSIFVVSSELQKHGHRKLARWIPVVDIAYDGTCGFMNYAKARWWK